MSYGMPRLTLSLSQVSLTNKQVDFQKVFRMLCTAMIDNKESVRNVGIEAMAVLNNCVGQQEFLQVCGGADTTALFLQVPGGAHRIGHGARVDNGCIICVDLVCNRNSMSIPSWIVLFCPDASGQWAEGAGEAAGFVPAQRSQSPWHWVERAGRACCGEHDRRGGRRCRGDRRNQRGGRPRPSQ